MEHPIQIGVGFNKDMACFELQMLVGNFKSEEDAIRYADIIKEFLEENAGADMGRIH